MILRNRQPNPSTKCTCSTWVAQKSLKKSVASTTDQREYWITPRIMHYISFVFYISFALHLHYIQKSCHVSTKCMTRHDLNATFASSFHENKRAVKAAFIS